MYIEKRLKSSQDRDLTTGWQPSTIGELKIVVAAAITVINECDYNTEKLTSLTDEQIAKDISLGYVIDMPTLLFRNKVGDTSCTCGASINSESAGLSRSDNETPLCKQCEQAEALNEYFGNNNAK